MFEMKKKIQKMQHCTACELHLHRKHVVTGRGNVSSPYILFVGEAPGDEEDERGVPFVGRSGALLNEWIKDLELKSVDYFITNTVCCHPPENRKPRKKEIAICTSIWLNNVLDYMDPGIVVPIGTIASSLFLGDDYKTGITKDAGQFFRRDYNGQRRLFYPIIHPSYFLHRGQTGREYWSEMLEQLKVKLFFL